MLYITIPLILSLLFLLSYVFLAPSFPPSSTFTLSYALYSHNLIRRCSLFLLPMWITSMYVSLSNSVSKFLWNKTFKIGKIEDCFVKNLFHNDPVSELSKSHWFTLACIISANLWIYCTITHNIRPDCVYYII